MSQNIQISQIIATAFERPPANRPKYDASRMEQYFRLDKDQIMQILLENCHNPNFYSDELMHPITNDEKILEDLRNLLINTIVEEYAELCEKNTHFALKKFLVQIQIKPLLSKNFDELIFKRTANTCTPYGFI
jgi:hypothetical protein